MRTLIRSLISGSIATILVTTALVCTPGARAADQGLVGWGSSKLPNAELGTIAQIAAGHDYTIALRSDHTLIGWGANIGGQATPPAGNDYTAIAAGPVHALALKEDGTIVGWGDNQYGQLWAPAGTYSAIAAGYQTSLAIKSDGSLAQWGAALRPEPAFALPTGNNFIAIAAGPAHYLALRADGSVAAWGANTFGKINAPAGTGFIAIAAGGEHSLALRSDGAIVAWGDNRFTQAGAPIGTFTAISAGGSHSVARKSDGSVHAWGLTDSIFGTPVATGFVAIAAGNQHCVALRADGTVTEWGITGFGQTAPYTGVAQVAASRFHGLALMQDGSLVGWGANVHGQAIPPAGNNFKAVAVGDEHSIALDTDGRIAVWGRDIAGEPPPTEAGFLAIAVAGNYHVAIKAVSPLAGSLVFFGDDTSLISNMPAGDDFKAIAVGGGHGLALRDNGSIVAWGANDYGQTTPQPGNDFTAIAAGKNHSLALKADGTIVGWGHNAWGQATAPTTTTYTAIAAAEDHNVAITEAGSLTTWGLLYGGFGGGTKPTGTNFTQVAASPTYFLALGDGSDSPDPAPVPVITYPSPGKSFTEDAFTIVATIPGDLSSLSRVEILLAFRELHVVEMQIYNQEANFTPEVRQDVSGLTKGTAYKITVRTETIDGAVATSEPVFFNLLPEPEDENSCAAGVVDDIGQVYYSESASTVGPVNHHSPQLSAPNSRERGTAMAVQPLDLDVLRAFRDDVLSTTPAGEYYTDLYNRMSLPLIETMLAHPAQIVPIYDALREWTPAIQALVDGQGGTVTITPEMVAHAQSILTNLRAVASGELAALMDAETIALDPTTWSGQSIGQLLARVESQTRPPPSIIAPPGTQAITAGSTLLLAVESAGAGPLTYQWFKHGVALPGATAATYTVPSAQRFHAGDYTVTVSNPFGSTPSPAASLAVNAAAANEARLLNLSTRGLAQAGDNVLIPGFVLSGSAAKRVLIRAVGPTLSGVPFNLGAAVAPDPAMALRRLDTSVIPNVYVEVATNDDWATNANAGEITTTAAQLFAFPFQDPKEAALLVDLAPGQYTVTAGDRNGTSGIAIVELYDADPDGSGSRLINISNRGFCGVGDQVMIPGFVVSSEGPKTVLVRVIGPGLADFGVTGTMADPKLEIYAAGGSTPILASDNWGENPDFAYTAQVAQQVSAFALAAGSTDAAFVVTLPPGGYTIIGSSAGAGGTGVVLVELYVVP